MGRVRGGAQHPRYMSSGRAPVGMLMRARQIGEHMAPGHPGVGMKAKGCAWIRAQKCCAGFLVQPASGLRHQLDMIQVDQTERGLAENATQELVEGELHGLHRGAMRVRCQGQLNTRLHGSAFVLEVNGLGHVVVVFENVAAGANEERQRSATAVAVLVVVMVMLPEALLQEHLEGLAE